MSKNYRVCRRSLSILLGIIVLQAIYGAFMSFPGPVQALSAGLSEGAAAFPFQSAEGVEYVAAGSTAPGKQSRMEIPYGGNKLVIFSDTHEEAGGNLHRATGNVTITFLDMIVTCDEAEYNDKTLRVSTRSPTRFRSKKASLTTSGAAFDPVTQTVTLHDAAGYFYETSGRSDREFFLTGGMSQNIKAEKLDIHWGAERKD